MVDALNVRLYRDGDAGVIKNVEGNRIIPPKDAVVDALPGRNKCVGVCTSERTSVCTSSSTTVRTTSIYRYIFSWYETRMSSRRLQNSVLNFNDTAYINADLIVNQDTEHLIFHRR